MTTKKVYILMGNYNHADRDVLSVYASKESADRKKGECESHKATEPKMTKLVDYHSGGKWWVARDKWSNGLPYGENYSAYYVVEQELLP